MNILVTGATGSIGRYAVRMLTAGKARFRALVRTKDKGESLGCDYVVGDFNAPETLRAALQGVDRVLLNGGVDEAMVRQQVAVIDAAKAAGVAHIVRISSAGASARSDRTLNQWHGAIDEHLQGSGMAWSLLRPTYFMQNFLGSARSIREAGELHGAFKNGRLAFIDCSDIAACAVTLLTGPVRSGDTLVLTGREALSFAEVAAKFSAQLGRPVRYVDRPVHEFVQAMESRGLPASVADSFGKMMESFASGRASEITSCVKDVTGRDARTFDDFLADNLEPFHSSTQVTLPSPRSPS